MFDPDLLRSFLAVIDGGSFTQAGRRLHATQSTVSGHIKRLEAQAGHRLMERTRGGVVALTPKGELLADDARHILRMHEAARIRLSDVSLSGIVRLGMSDDFASGRGFTTALAEFARLHPNVQLEVQVGNSATLIAAVEAGDLDYVLAKRMADDGAGELLAQHDVLWASGHAGDPTTDPVRLVLFPAPCIYQTLALNALRKAGRSWVVSYTSPSLAGIRSALAAGLGVAPLARDLISGDLRGLSEAAGLPPLGKVGLFLHEREGEASDAMRQLCQLLRKNHSVPI